LQFQNSGDPVTFAPELVNGGGPIGGQAIRVDLPDLPDGPTTGPLGWDLAFGEVSLNSLIDLISQGSGAAVVAEHKMANYASGIDALTGSGLFSTFIQNPSAYHVIVGLVGASDLVGKSLDDFILGRTTNDVLQGRGGNDLIDGGEGADTAVYQLNLGDKLSEGGFSGWYDIARYGSEVVVTAKPGVPQSADGTDTLYNIEFLKFNDKTISVFNNPDLPDLSGGTAVGGDVSDGKIAAASGGASGNESSLPPTLSAGKTINGNDTSEYLSGTSGPDVILGSGGDDVLTGYGGQDSFDGGVGSDTVDYSYEPVGVNGTILLANNTAAFAGFYTEQLISIENVWMGAGNDIVHGDSGNNDLRGGPGDDVLEGGPGNDVVYGDWKYSDNGGNDTAILSYTFGSGYTVSGSANALHIVGAEGDDWYYKIENFQFAGGVVKTAAEVLSYSPVPAGTHTIERVSVASDGTQGNGYSAQSAISADGRYIVFQSSASNLIAGDTNSTDDVFIENVVTGTIIRASTTSSGEQANNLSFIEGGQQASISADGRYVVFGSLASNLVTGDTNGTYDIFVKDLVTGGVTRASTTVLGDRQTAAVSSRRFQQTDVTSYSTAMHQTWSRGIRTEHLTYL